MDIRISPEDRAAADVRAKRIVQQRGKPATGEDYERKYIGLLGELAVARAFGLTIDATSIASERPYESDRGVDLTLPSGLTVQVKTTRLKSSNSRSMHLILHSADDSDFRSDIAALVCLLPDRETAQIVGWVSRERFADQYIVKNMGSGDRAVLRGDNLEPVELLLRVAGRQLPIVAQPEPLAQSQLPW